MRSLLFGVVSLVMVGCAGRTPAPATPAANDEAGSASAPASESSSDEAASSGQTLDVGMEFKDKGDNENRRANREAPPTGAWKPVEKDKTIDSKKSATASK